MKKKNIVKFITYLFVIYCACLIFILFLYGYRTENQFNMGIFSREHFEQPNLVPFRTICTYLESFFHHTINTNIVITNLLGNLLLFVPMGMAVPVLFPQKFNRLWKTVLFVVILVILAESIQFLTFTGSADIDDLILNTLGATIGYGIIKINFLRKILKLDVQDKGGCNHSWTKNF